MKFFTVKLHLLSLNNGLHFQHTIADNFWDSATLLSHKYIDFYLEEKHYCPLPLTVVSPIEEG